MDGLFTNKAEYESWNRGERTSNKSLRSLIDRAARFHVAFNGSTVPVGTLMNPAQTPLFNVLHRTQCYCGVDSDDPDELGEATCNSPCAGDASQTCGGRNAISVYQYIVLEPEFLGCWTDSPRNRIMDIVESSNAMTNDVSCVYVVLQCLDASLTTTRSIIIWASLFGTRPGNICWT